MKADGYTKIMLTLIAVLLAVLVLERGAAPGIAYGQLSSGNFDHIQFSGGVAGFYMFDSTTGDVFAYDINTPNKVIQLRVAKPGDPFVRSVRTR